MSQDAMRPTWQELLLQSYCISSIHGGQMWEGRVTQEQLPRWRCDDLQAAGCFIVQRSVRGRDWRVVNCVSMTIYTDSLFEQALTCLRLKVPKQKVEATYALQESWLNKTLKINTLESVASLLVPGRPEKPELVDPRDVPRRNFTSLKGRLTLVHAIAHIEFNAINLALDAVHRFQHMPEQYYTDWCLVAAEEAQHFTMLSDYLESHGVYYGDFPAHNGLWEMAVKTDADVLVRMALVPRVLEARGLDVTPGMIDKLQSTGDVQLISILQKIFDDEIGHVKIGTHWYHYLCRDRNIDSEQTFLELIDKYMQGAKFGPFEIEARIEAGFTEQELQSLLDRTC